jgi:hypothetical protein
MFGLVLTPEAMMFMGIAAVVAIAFGIACYLEELHHLSAGRQLVYRNRARLIMYAGLVFGVLFTLQLFGAGGGFHWLYTHVDRLLWSYGL